MQDVSSNLYRLLISVAHYSDNPTKFSERSFENDMSLLLRTHVYIPPITMCILVILET
jgi:hypothetical protein